MKCCETCGQILPETEFDGLKLHPNQQRLFDIVKRAGSGGILSTDLFDLLYRDDPNGGPDTGMQTLYTRISLLNVKLRRFGYVIRAPGGSGPQAYSLRRRTKKWQRGETVLSAEVKAKICELYTSKKLTQKQLAKRYGVSQGHISIVVNGGSTRAYKEARARYREKTANQEVAPC